MASHALKGGLAKGAGAIAAVGLEANTWRQEMEENQAKVQESFSLERGMDKLCGHEPGIRTLLRFAEPFQDFFAAATAKRMFFGPASICIAFSPW